LKLTRDQARAVLRARFDPVAFATDVLGVELFPKQAEILRRFYKGDYRELVLVAGMRSGKSFLATVFALYEAFLLLTTPSPQKKYGLHPSSLIHILLVAKSEDQARDVLLSRALGIIQDSWFFDLFPRKVRKDTIEFPSKRIMIWVGPSTSNTLVGRTAKAVILDELARFPQTESGGGAWMIYHSLKAATVTFGNDGHRIIISSPLRSDDILMQLYNDPPPDTLALRYATWEFNPHIKFEDLQTELQRDPVAFWRDFGAQPSESLYPYFARLDEVSFGDHNAWLPVSSGIPYSPPEGTYVIAGDPALRWDAFGIAVARMDGERVIYDLVGAIVPEKGKEISPSQVRELFDRLIDIYQPAVVVFDTHMYPELEEHIRTRGVPVKTRIVKKRHYDMFKEALYSGKVELPAFPRLIKEMKGVQVVNERRVDHPRGGSKDVIDAVVNAYVALIEDVKKPIYVPYGEAW